MSTFQKKFKRAVSKVTGFFPTRLPVGITEFNVWAESIIDTYGLDIGTNDHDSIVFGLAGAVMHLGATESHKPKRFFAKLLHKGAASQVAYFVMKQLKEKQAQAQQDNASAANATVVANG